VTIGRCATLGWDFTNRLQTHTEAAGQETTYRYDPFGRRIQKSVDPDGAGGSPAVTTWYVWDGDMLLGEYDASGGRDVRYAYAGGFAPVQVAYDNGSGEDVYDVHTDHLDTPRLLTDDTGAVALQSSVQGRHLLRAKRTATFAHLRCLVFFFSSSGAGWPQGPTGPQPLRPRGSAGLRGFCRGLQLAQPVAPSADVEHVAAV
jgi:YD repeat-containing protein